MNEGFKGTRLGIRSCELKNESGMQSLDILAEYLDSDGTIHGVVRHRLPVPMDAVDDQLGLRVAIDDLLRIVVRQISAAHFINPDDQKEKVLLGIAEHLGAVSRAAEDPGTQG